MTARQPPGEKGAKACTIGSTSLATGVFAPFFRVSLRNEVHFLYSEQHIVRTHLGTFSLDDASYAAYLEGKLWISWNAPADRKARQQRREKSFVPVNVSDEALRLRDAAAKQDVVTVLQQVLPQATVGVPYQARMAELSIEEMNLSVRSSNALMRANARTFGRLFEILQMEEGLKKIRNLGIKSEKEIIRNFFSACYYRLTQTEQAVFWQKAIETGEAL